MEECLQAVSQMSRFFARRLGLDELTRMAEHLDACGECDARFTSVGRELHLVRDDWREYVSLEHVEGLCALTAAAPGEAVLNRLTNALTHLAAGDLRFELPDLEETETHAPELAGLTAATVVLAKNLAILGATLGPVGAASVFRPIAHPPAGVQFRGAEEPASQRRPSELLTVEILPRLQSRVGVLRAAVVFCSAYERIAAFGRELTVLHFRELIHAMTTDRRLIDALGPEASRQLEAAWLDLVSEP